LLDQLPLLHVGATVTSPTRKHRWLLSAIATLALALPACSDAAGGGGKGGHGGKGGPHGGGGPPRGKGKGGPESQTLKVKTISVRNARIERYYKTSGTLSAIKSAEITAVQAAIIRDIRVEEGDAVKTGDVLAKLDGRELSLQTDVARVQLSSLEKELERLESASGVIAAEEIVQQRNAVKEARAALKLSRHQAKQTVVYAPFAGTIVERHVDEGNLATTATALFSLADTSVLELLLHLPERDAASVAVGTPVEIELVDGTTFTAKITRRAPIVDATTGTVKFTVHTSEYPAPAVPGAFARARVLVDQREAAPSLASGAIFRLDGLPHVFVVEDGKAQRRKIDVGLEGGGRTEITGGLGPEDQVVAEGSSGVTQGMPLVADPMNEDVMPTAEREASKSGA